MRLDPCQGQRLPRRAGLCEQAFDDVALEHSILISQPSVGQFHRMPAADQQVAYGRVPQALVRLCDTAFDVLCGFARSQ